jgi:hypothetical protein
VIVGSNLHKHKKMRQGNVHPDGDNAVAQEEEQNAHRKMTSLNGELRQLKLGRSGPVKILGPAMIDLDEATVGYDLVGAIAELWSFCELNQWQEVARMVETCNAAS